MPIGMGYKTLRGKGPTKKFKVGSKKPKKAYKKVPSTNKLNPRKARLFKSPSMKKC